MLKHSFLLGSLAALLIWVPLNAQDDMSGNNFVFKFNPQIPQQRPAPRCSAPVSEKTIFTSLPCDQYKIWGTALQPKRHWQSIVPFVLGTAALIATDQYAARAVIQTPPGTAFDVGDAFSWPGRTEITWTAAGSMWMAGLLIGNNRLRNTGLLTAEAYFNLEIVKQVMKLATQRERPADFNGNIINNARGKFWAGSETGSSSFPAGHAMEAWSLAAVVSSQYPDKPLIKYAAYGVAIIVSSGRIITGTHFNSDVLVASVFGYLIGKYVVRAHHP